jgi:hypothetical protein
MDVHRHWEFSDLHRRAQQWRRRIQQLEESVMRRNQDEYHIMMAWPGTTPPINGALFSTLRSRIIALETLYSLSYHIHPPQTIQYYQSFSNEPKGRDALIMFCICVGMRLESLRLAAFVVGVEYKAKSLPTDWLPEAALVQCLATRSRRMIVDTNTRISTITIGMPCSPQHL